jgi:hypothetical protein
MVSEWWCMRAKNRVASVHATREFSSRDFPHHGLIDVAPHPILTWLDGPYDWIAGFVKMLGRMPIQR